MKFLLLLFLIVLIAGFAKAGWAADASVVSAVSSPQTSLFEAAGKPFDVAQQLLDGLLFPTQAAGASISGIGTANATVTELQRGIITVLSYFNSTLLVLAVLIVVYHLVVMVSESAHYGTPLGKRNKQLWAPVRLVLALGLLVPVGGFSTAQYLVMRMARMGSDLASNGWNSFAETLKPKTLTLHGSSQTDPTATIAHLVAAGICVKSYELFYSGLPPEQTIPAVVGSATLQIKTDEGKNASRTNYLAKSPDGKILPVICVTLSWIEPDPQSRNGTLPSIASHFAKAHLAAIAEVQTAALNLGGSLTLGSLGIFTNSQMSYAEQFTALKQTYQQIFTAALSKDFATPDKQGNITIIAPEKLLPPRPYGWLLAGTALQALAIQDSTLFSPELAAPVVSFQYPLLAALNDKPTLQIVRGLSFAHILFQQQQADNPSWFNPTLDHGKGPIKQAFTLLGTVLAQQTGGTTTSMSLLDNTSVAAPDKAMAAKLYQPMALAFRALDLSDQFWAVAEWSARANSPVFGSAILFGNLAEQVRATFLAANPRLEQLQLIPAALLDSNRPADFARYLIAILGLVIFLPALLLLFLLPLLPLVHFAIGGLLWLMALFQGIVAAPLWALTFLSLHGDEAIPPASRMGLTLLFTIFLRPIMMVAGFISALLLMQVGFGFTTIMLSVFSYDGLQGSPTLFSIGALVVLVAKLILYYMIANNSLRCINLFPEFAMRWLGSAAGGAAGGADGQATATASAAAAAGNGNNSSATAAAVASVSNSVNTMQTSQQQWQRKVLGVLEQIAGVNDRNPSQNTGLFPVVHERGGAMTSPAMPASAAGLGAGTIAAVDNAAAASTMPSAGFTEESGANQLMSEIPPPPETLPSPPRDETMQPDATDADVRMTHVVRDDKAD